MSSTYGANPGFVKPDYLGIVPPLPRAYALTLVPSLVLALAGRGMAQGLPTYASVNPAAESRSGVYFQPYLQQDEGWRPSLTLDYASTIEFDDLPAAGYVLDSEQLRLRLGLSRNLGSGTFLLAEAQVRGAYGGFLDGVIDWYHGLFGIEMPERDRRPRNVFLYDIVLSDGLRVHRSPGNLFLGDARVGLGMRYGSLAQSVLSVTLPTSTGPDGYGRGVLSVSLLNTVRARVTDRLTYEGGLGLGYTPTHGALAPVQREAFLGASSGLRVRLWGRQSLYGNLVYHSPQYRRSMPALDRRELTFDFGWVLASAGGREWRIGMAEDLEPGGPALDLVFRFGVEGDL